MPKDLPVSDRRWRRRLAATISRWWEEIVLRRRLGEIADVFIVLPVCAANQLEEKWRRRRANEPKKEPLAPGASRRAGTKLLEFLFLAHSFPGLVFAVAVVIVIVCSRRRLLVVSPSPGVMYIVRRRGAHA